MTWIITPLVALVISQIEDQDSRLPFPGFRLTANDQLACGLVISEGMFYPASLPFGSLGSVSQTVTVRARCFLQR